MLNANIFFPCHAGIVTLTKGMQVVISSTRLGTFNCRQNMYAGHPDTSRSPPTVLGQREFDIYQNIYRVDVASTTVSFVLLGSEMSALSNAQET